MYANRSALYFLIPLLLIHLALAEAEVNLEADAEAAPSIADGHRIFPRLAEIAERSKRWSWFGYPWGYRYGYGYYGYPYGFGCGYGYPCGYGPYGFGGFFGYPWLKSKA